MNTQHKYSSRFLALLGLLAVSSVSLADPCDSINSGPSQGTYAVYYPTTGTTCTWTYNPSITHQGTLIDMIGTVNNGHLNNTKNVLNGIFFNPKGEISKKISTSNDDSCANGATVEFLGSCVNGALNLTLVQVSAPATGNVIGTTLIGNGKFQTNTSTFNFRVDANR